MCQPREHMQSSWEICYLVLAWYHWWLTIFWYGTWYALVCSSFFFYYDPGLHTINYLCAYQLIQRSRIEASKPGSWSWYWCVLLSIARSCVPSILYCSLISLALRLLSYKSKTLQANGLGGFNAQKMCGDRCKQADLSYNWLTMIWCRQHKYVSYVFAIISKHIGLGWRATTSCYYMLFDVACAFVRYMALQIYPVKQWRFARDSVFMLTRPVCRIFNVYTFVTAPIPAGA